MTASRLIGIVVLASVIFIGTVAVINQPNQQAFDAEFDTETVELIDMDVRVNATGKVAPLRETSMTFGNSYIVSEVFVREGDTVQKGDVLATLEMEDYEITLASAQNSLARQQNNFERVVAPPRDIDLMAAQAGIDAAQAAYWAAGQTAPTEEEIEIARLGVEQAKNELWQAQLERDLLVQIPIEFRGGDTVNPRAQEIQVNDGLNQAETGIAIAEQEFAETVDRGPSGNAFGSSAEQVASAEVTFDNVVNPDEFDVEIAALSMHQTALGVERLEAQIVNLQLVAPFDGIVIENNLEVGELPPMGAAIVLADNSVMLVNLEVDETDVVQLAMGMPVSIGVDALPETEITGTITMIDELPLPEKSVPTYRVQVKLAPSDEPVRSGMSAEGEIVVDALTDVTVVPTQYIQVDENGEFVMLIEEGELRRVNITTGRTSGRFTQIIDGVTPGQRVVLPQE